MSIQNANDERTPAVFGLLDAVFAMTAVMADYGPEYAQVLSRAVAECEAKFIAAEARFNPANDVRGL